MTQTQDRASRKELRASQGVSIRGLSVQHGRTAALHDVSLEIAAGALTAIIGPAGAGKTTLLRCINRMAIDIDGATAQGEIEVGRFSVLRSPRSAHVLRKRVGMVFAVPQALPGSILHNLLYGPLLHGERRGAALLGRVEQCLRIAELWSEVQHRLSDAATRLSGGQLQRLCLARALMLQPDVLLLDEPTSGLDPISTERIEHSLRALRGSLTILLVTNSLHQAKRVSDDSAFLLQGSLIEFAPTSELFHGARDDRTRAYLAGQFG